jgi:RecB family endonuclease NucS
MYNSEQFAVFFLEQGNKPSSLNNYKTVLKRVDLAIGGLDEKLASEGVAAVLRWAETTQDERLRPYLKDVSSITRKYVEFFGFTTTAEPVMAAPAVHTESDAAQSNGSVFQIEREMQRAVRNQLATLERGLREADGGFEVTVPTGRIDILAEDSLGRLVVIELKVGTCPAGALEQAQGYAEAIEAREGRPTRAIVIAQSFPHRVLSAARRMRDIELRTYQYLLQFQPTQ